MGLWPEGLNALKKVATAVGWDVKGAAVTRDAGWDANPKRQGLFNPGMMPHLHEPPRHRNATTRGRTRCFPAARHV
jgi:hypothetical protein